MSVYLRGKTYWIWIYRKGEKPIQFSAKTSSKHQAELREAAYKLSQKMGSSQSDYLHNALDIVIGNADKTLVGNPNDFPLDDLFAQYVRVLKMKNIVHKPNTLRTRENWFKGFTTWAAKNTEARTFFSVDVKIASQFLESLVKRNLKDNTKHQTIGGLAAAWNLFSKLFDCSNPWVKVMPRVIEGSSRRAFTHEEETKVLEAAKTWKEPEYYLASMISRWVGGLRYGDAVSVRWENVDFENNIISVTPKKTETSTKVVITSYMHPDLVKAIKEFGSKDSPFLTPRLHRFYPGQPEMDFRKLLDSVEIKSRDLTFHSWRHTFATRATEAGVSAETLRTLGGWATDKMASHYDHADKAEKNIAASKAAINLMARVA